MKFVAFRVERGVYDSVTRSIDHDLWGVRGQRETDLNWELLEVFGSEAEAKAYAIGKRQTTKVRPYCPVYDTRGQGYLDIDPMVC